MEEPMPAPSMIDAARRSPRGDQLRHGERDIGIVRRLPLMHAHIADFKPEAIEQALESLLEPKPAMIGADCNGSFRRYGNRNLVGWHLDDAHPARRRNLARRWRDDAAEWNAKLAAGRDVLCGDDALQVVIVARDLWQIEKIPVRRPTRGTPTEVVHHLPVVPTDPSYANRRHKPNVPLTPTEPRLRRRFLTFALHSHVTART